MTLFGLPIAVVFFGLLALGVVLVIFAIHSGGQPGPAGGITRFLTVVITVVLVLAMLIVGAMWLFGVLMARI